jgi:hypothetical protein
MTANNNFPVSSLCQGLSEIHAGFWVLKYLLHLFGEFDLHLDGFAFYIKVILPQETPSASR